MKGEKLSMDESLFSGMGDKKESSVFETILPALVNALAVFIFQLCGLDVINSIAFVSSCSNNIWITVGGWMHLTKNPEK